MDRITAMRARRAGILDRMDAIMAGIPDGEDMTADHQAQFEALKAEDDKVVADLARAEDLERRRAAAARPAAALPGLSNPAGAPAQPVEKGLRFGAMVRALAAAGGIPHIAAQIAESWGESGLFANQNMGSGAAGGFLVPEDISSDFIELLRPASVVMAMQPLILPIPNGNLTMNRQTAGITASYVGEQQDILESSWAVGQVKLSAKKLTALTAISNDLLKFASTAADRMSRDDMVTSVALRTDLAFIRGAGTENSPRGMRFFHLGYTALAATNVLTMTTTPTLVTVTSDLGRLELALKNADVPMIRPGWLMAPRTEMFLMNLRDGNGNIAFPEMANGKLRSKPYRITTQIPVNLGSGSDSELYLADFAQVIVGEAGGVEIAVSTEAAYKDASGTMQAAFSRDETIMRGIVQHDIGTRHLAAVAILTGVTWTP